MVVSVNRAELCAMATLPRCLRTGIEWHDMALDKTMQNSAVESLDARFRDEGSNERLLSSHGEARQKIRARCNNYNHHQ